jgi:hypothetical protein
MPKQKLLLQASTDADLKIYAKKDLCAPDQNTTN